MDHTTNDPSAPLSSLPGKPVWVVEKYVLKSDRTMSMVLSILPASCKGMVQGMLTGDGYEHCQPAMHFSFAGVLYLAHLPYHGILFKIMVRRFTNCSGPPIKSINFIWSCGAEKL